jgi:hypothetical protein
MDISGSESTPVNPETLLTGRVKSPGGSVADCIQNQDVSPDIVESE